MKRKKITKIKEKNNSQKGKKTVINTNEFTKEINTNMMVFEEKKRRWLLWMGKKTPTHKTICIWNQQKEFRCGAINPIRSLDHKQIKRTKLNNEEIMKI